MSGQKVDGETSKGQGISVKGVRGGGQGRGKKFDEHVSRIRMSGLVKEEMGGLEVGGETSKQ